MEPPPRPSLVETHLDDLQADIEAEARKLDQIQQSAAAIRDALFQRRLEHGALMTWLVKQIATLRAGCKEQLALMRQLRQDIRRRTDD
jgi:septal ring factor EnvC (AmiA/AmiB activator)